MLKILLISLLTLTGTIDQQQFYCQQYNLVQDGTGLYKTDHTCYVSSFSTDFEDKYILTVTTDSVTVKFAILRSFFLPDGKGTESFAVILGQPNQVYAIREMHLKDAYYFSCHPIRLSTQPKKDISGMVIEISNQKICTF